MDSDRNFRLKEAQMSGQKIQMKSGGWVYEAVVNIHVSKIFVTESCSLPGDAKSACLRSEISFVARCGSTGKEAPICRFPVASWTMRGHRNPGSSYHQMIRINSFSKLRRTIPLAANLSQYRQYATVSLWHFTTNEVCLLPRRCPIITIHAMVVRLVDVQQVI
jgi:hypothetical protein